MCWTHTGAINNTNINVCAVDLPSKILKCWYTNADSLINKIDELKGRIKVFSPDKIIQGTTSKVNCILFNRLLSPVLLNKSGLVRAKAGSFTLKTLNGCFSNCYLVRTWPVFAETVTYSICTFNYKYSI